MSGKRDQRKAVFLDKDGTLIEDVPFNTDWRRIRFSSGTWDALRVMAAEGYRFVIVSNQSGIARGYCTYMDVLRVETFIRTQMAEHGLHLSGFYFCPHHPDGTVPGYSRTCACRKPKPGLLYQAAAELGIRLRRSWMIGDILDDIEAGHNAGCRCVLINNGNETEWKLSPQRAPEIIAPDLCEAARRIVTYDQDTALV